MPLRIAVPEGNYKVAFIWYFILRRSSSTVVTQCMVYQGRCYLHIVVSLISVWIVKRERRSWNLSWGKAYTRNAKHCNLQCTINSEIPTITTYIAKFLKGSYNYWAESVVLSGLKSYENWYMHDRDQCRHSFAILDFRSYSLWQT